jgi:hypothetical protein
MRRSTSRIGKLPKAILEEVNEKLAAGWEYGRVRRWLFELVAEEDVPALGLLKGEKFSQVWVRAAKSASNAGHFCELALGNWFRGWHQQWARQKLLRGETIKTIKKAAVLTREAAALESDNRPAMQREETASDTVSGSEQSESQNGDPTIDGGNVLMRSVLIDAVEKVQSGSKDAKDIAQLANSWARLNQEHRETEKLKLKTEDALKAGLRAVKQEIMANPEALELFHKMSAVINRAQKPADPLAK